MRNVFLEEIRVFCGACFSYSKFVVPEELVERFGLELRRRIMQEI